METKRSLIPARLLLALLTLPLCHAHAQALPPAEIFQVLPSASDTSKPEITSYLQYQTELAWQQDAARRQHWTAVQTPAQMQRLQKELHASLLQMIGGLPAEHTSLHAVTTGRIQASGFHIEKIVFQSLPGIYVTALVYVPEDGAATHPAVLVPPGHAENGKIHYQDICQRLALRGYIAIVWDPVGQGERSQFWDEKNHRSRYNQICAEHAVMGNLAYLAGANLARWEIWDGIRAIDYLETRKDVDANRINITGTSGGGFQTSMLGALDPRIKVIIPSCYITSMPMRVHNRIFVDADSDPEQDPYGFIVQGVDHAGLLALMYPRPVMIASVTLDFFPIQGTHQTYEEVRALYSRFGRADRIAMVESYDIHLYSDANQQKAIAFLDRFNFPQRSALPVALPVTHEMKDADLLCTQKGQVMVEYPDAKSLVSYIQAYSAEYAHTVTLASINAHANPPSINTWPVTQFTGASREDAVQWEDRGSSRFDGLRIERYLLHNGPNLEMPLLYIHADTGTAPTKTAIWLKLAGKAGPQDWLSIQKLTAAGYGVISFDLRGTGEEKMHYRVQGDAIALVPHEAEAAYAFPISSVLAGFVYNSLLTGRPYFLQILDDIQIAQRFAAVKLHAPALYVEPATANEAVITQSFVALNPHTQTLSPSKDLLSHWNNILQAGDENWPVALLLPRAAQLKELETRHDRVQ